MQSGWKKEPLIEKVNAENDVVENKSCLTSIILMMPNKYFPLIYDIFLEAEVNLDNI